MPAQAVAERVRRLVVNFTDQPQHDDMAILALRMDVGAAVKQQPLAPEITAEPQPGG
jgi:hypothetical protein